MKTKFYNISAFFLVFLTITGVLACQKRSVGEVISDSALSLKLRTKLVKHNKIPSHKIYMKVREGIVTVKGALPDQDAINRTIELIEMEKGVKEVKAYLVLKEFADEKEDNEFKPVKKGTLDENSSWEEIDLD